jgi:GNAT superfamily N-acetyltransferase
VDAEIRRATEAEVEADWRSLRAAARNRRSARLHALDVEGFIWRDPASGRRGLVSWWIDGERAEIVSVHAEPPGSGTGTRIMDAAEEELRRRGVKTAVLATTNDNVRALNFYQKRGYASCACSLEPWTAFAPPNPVSTHGPGQNASPRHVGTGEIAVARLAGPSDPAGRIYPPKARRCAQSRWRYRHIRDMPPSFLKTPAIIEL